LEKAAFIFNDLSHGHRRKYFISKEIDCKYLHPKDLEDGRANQQSARDFWIVVQFCAKTWKLPANQATPRSGVARES
jgi:hypothetical protein